MATRTYVLVEDEVDPSEILGYYTLLPSTVAFPEGHPLQKRYPSDPPVYRLARLAIDNSAKGYGLGAYLLIECLKRIVDASLSVRSEEHTSELQSRPHLVCRLLLEKKKYK